MVQFQSIGVDWLTMSTDGLDGMKVASLAQSLFPSLTGAKQSEWMGYKGSYCEDGVFLGYNSEKVLVRMSGWSAATHALDFIPFAKRISRLDVQVTVRTSERDTGVAKRCYAQAEQASFYDANYPAFELRVGTKGDTMYLGTRTSDKFLRVYDKHAESNEALEYVNCWRYELELKANSALGTGRALLEQLEIDVYIAGLLSQHLHSHKLYPPFPPTAGVKGVVAPKKPDDDARKLRWLHEQVAPTVQRLSERGKYIQALVELGLLDPNTGEVRTTWDVSRETSVKEV